MKSDASLLKAARSDAAAFRELYDRYAARIYGFQLRRCGNEAAAYDLTAETFAQAWLARIRFRDEAGGSAGPWLFAIARHVLLASVRRGALERRACERLGLLEDLDRPATQPSEAWLDGLDEALASLPEAQREAVVLRVVDDLNYAEIGAVQSISPGAARVRVHRGLSALRHHIANALEAR